MKKISFKTKFEAVLLVSLLILLSIYGVFALTRTISNTQDTVEKYIRNSNGKYWDLTGENIQQAIWDLNGTGGCIWVGADVTINSSIIFNETHKIILDFQMHTITLGSNVPFINMTDAMWNTIKDVYVKPSTYHTSSIIVLYLGPSATWWEHVRYDIFENINIIEPSPYCYQHNWTGIELYMNGDSDISCNTFRNIRMYGCRNGIKLTQRASGAYGNCNVFEDIWIDRFINGIWFDVTEDPYGFNANTFSEITFQAVDSTGGYTEPAYGIRNIRDGGNRFINCNIVDWYAVYDPVYKIEISSNATETHIDGYDIWDASECVDNGIMSYIVDGEGGKEYTMDTYDYVIFKRGETCYAKEGKTGKIVAYGADADVIYHIIAHHMNKDGSLFFKAGTYYWGSAQANDNLENIRIVGENKQTTILKGSAGTGSEYGFFYMYQLNNVTFEELTFDGNTSGPPVAMTNNYYGLRFRSAGNLTVRNCIFKNLAKWGIRVDNINNVRIEDNDFINCGLWVNDWMGIVSAYGNVRGLDISGNTMEWSTNPNGTWNGGGNNWLRVIYLYPGDDGSVITKTRILNNNIDYGGYSGVDKGIWLNGGNARIDLNNCTVTGNTVYAYAQALYLDHCENITINSNVCWGETSGITWDNCGNINPSSIDTTNIQGTN